MRRMVTLLMMVVLVGLIAGTALADGRDRHKKEDRDHQLTISLHDRAAGPYARMSQPRVAPRVPVIVRPTPVYQGYTYSQPVVVRRPVVYRYVPVVPVRPKMSCQSISIFSITFSW